MTDREVAAWWGTSVSRIEPGVIELRGHPVQNLLGSVGFGEMIWLMLRGTPAPEGHAALLEAALVAGVDHGPQAPSIAIARMTATCGVGLNNAVASGVNALGDVHGGAGQQCVELLEEIRQRQADGQPVEEAVDEILRGRRERGIRYVPGFGHRIHDKDPRRDPLLSLVEDAVRDGVVTGEYLHVAYAVEAALAPVPMNIDGATAVIYAELGFAASLARGLFVLSRSVGILAHAWEETQQGRRNKGPLPPAIRPTYLG
jgi:citrate synthase